MDTLTQKDNFILTFEKSVRECWNKPALDDYRVSSITYGELAREIETNVLLWKAAGLRKDDRIAINAKSSSNWAKIFLSSQVGEFVSVQIFPGDLFKMLECSPGFSMSRLTYSSHLFDEVMRNFPPSFISYIESNPVHNLSTSDGYLLHTGYFRVISEKVSDIDNMCRYEIVVNLLRNFFMEIYDKVVRICRIDTSQGKHKSRLVEGFISQLMEHPEHRDVGYYAHELCITPKYLSVIVSEAMGLSAKDFIDRNVTLEIQYMLRTTDMSVKEIAERLEFPSSSSLCRYFRMHAGMTVTEYRRSAMG